jgi:hypothetical protein
MHKMRAKLYPNYLPQAKGAFIARTANESSVTVEDICAAMKNRGGYDGSYEDAVQTVRHFFKETEYQLADGFSVNMGVFSIHPNIGGTFDSADEIHDHKKHPITFRFQSLTPLRKLRESIEVIIEGIADVNGYIDEYIEHEGNYTNSVFVSNGMFTIHGHKIKIAGDDPACGLYFFPENNPANAVKATRIAENTASKVTGVTPQVPGVNIKLEIRTQFAGSGTLLKTPRVIPCAFTLEQY